MAQTCDVVVIGGGIAGVSLGYHLAADRGVVVLDAEPMLASHSTGRSAATYLTSYGPSPVRKLTVASRARFTELAARFDQPDPLSPLPAVWAATDDESDAAASRLLAECTDELRLLDARAALELAPVLDPDVLRYGVCEENSDTIDVLAVHQAYLRGFRERGGQVRTEAPVDGLARNGTGWRVRAGDAEFDCALVVNAAGAWADRISALAGLPEIGFVPKRRTLFTSPPGADSGWPETDAVVADAADRWYAKHEGPNVLASPADAEPCEPCDARADELGIARAIEDINAATRLRLRTVYTSWGGLRTFSPDGVPVVGELAEFPGFAYFAGQGGYGIQMGPALASLGHAVLTGQEVPADIPVAPEELSPARFG
ncbi:D-arginine dehydrogenase [Tamaricihabitans halophyticus]|uniref:D-arginine dehydrogenase n=1 Tax=Tamaricihabitans halophyticus TaxID=1262583 RepID=A0A4R2Q4Z1_9PSEU|nr:FAD-binding oxidoreductase [Tamaricihabitans halophyticus]TCP43883.1 D-arginine dehydrogenase [Tamaricihabitans halophyticus]